MSDPNQTVAWNGKTEALFRLTHYQEALDAAESALALNRSDARALSNKGALLLSLKRSPEEALAWVKRALALDPESIDAHVNRCFILGQLKRYQEALQDSVLSECHFSPEGVTKKGPSRSWASD